MVELESIRFVTTLKDYSRPATYLSLQMNFKFISQFFTPDKQTNKQTKIKDCRRRLSVLELMLLASLKTTALEINIT